MTVIALALLFHAIYDVFDYYSSEPFFELYLNYLLLLLYAGIILTNHVYYRYEHKRSNNFIGRLMNNVLFFVFIFIIGRLKRLIISGSYFEWGLDFDLIEVISILMATAIFVVGFELILSIVKFFTKKIFKCQFF